MPARAPRRTQEQRRTETEQRVLEAATALIARSGSRNVSLAEVGRVAGYSRGIVNHHFGTKKQLLEAVVRAAQSFDVPEAGSTGLDHMTNLITTYLATLPERAPGWQAFLRLWADAIGEDPALGEIYAERDAWFRSELAATVDAGIADGSIRRDADSSAVALSVVGLLRGLCMQLMSSASDVDPVPLAGEAAELVRRGLKR